MRILFITPHIRWPLASGGHIRRWNVLQGLKQAGSVDVLVCGCQEHQLSEESYSGCESAYSIGSEMFRTSKIQEQIYKSTLGRAKMVFLSSLPNAFVWGDRFEARRQFKNLVKECQYDVICVETVRYETMLRVSSARKLCRKTKIIIDGDDFSWMRDLGVLRGGPRYGAKVLDYIDVIKMYLWEMTCAWRCACVMRCSEIDRRHQRSKKAVVISNGTNVPNSIRRNPRGRILFVGMLDYAPNENGILWFIREVWPKIRREVEGVALDIIGEGASAELTRVCQVDGIVLHGYVPDLAEFYERANLSIVPLHAGGGTRLKIFEAIGRMVPVVATEIGAYGIPLTDRHGVFRRNRSEEFARVCINILLDGESKLDWYAENGHNVVMSNYDWGAIQRKIARLVEAIN